jgi:Fic family protein
MVVLRKRRMGRSEFYYLVHSVKVNGRVEKKEKYLGKGMPKNVEKLKTDFLNELYQEMWGKKLDAIKKNFASEFLAMPKPAREKYIDQFMIKFTYDTNRIEGSRLTFRETASLLEDKITPPNKPLEDVKEAEAHKKVFYEMLGHKGDLNLGLVLYWHKLLFENSKPEVAGKIRTYQVEISGSKFRPPFPAELNPLLREFFGWYNREKTKLHPVILAALAHLKFVSIHPFGDGNGRLSRLIMNFILHKHDYPMLNIPYANRSGYYNALERSQMKKDEHFFAFHVVKRYLKGYERYAIK